MRWFAFWFHCLWDWYIRGNFDPHRADNECPTPCDPDCDADCHEWHLPRWKRDHAPGDHK